MLFMRVALLCLCGLICGCAVVVKPPVNPSHPVTAYLVDSGRTSSIVVPNRAGAMVHYAYGDWDWYALRKTAFWRAVPALLWPTPAGLGRMELTPESLSMLKAQSQEVYAFEVEEAKAFALTDRLDSEFHRNAATLVHTPSVGLDFVRYDNSYWVFHNSNGATAQWLTELGADTRGWPLWSNWTVRETEPATDQARR